MYITIRNILRYLPRCYRTMIFCGKSQVESFLSVGILQKEAIHVNGVILNIEENLKKYVIYGSNIVSFRPFSIY